MLPAALRAPRRSFCNHRGSKRPGSLRRWSRVHLRLTPKLAAVRLAEAQPTAPAAPAASGRCWARPFRRARSARREAWLPCHWGRMCGNTDSRCTTTPSEPGDPLMSWRC